jgi:medium-chain acyl-[acyl-carrier-protein] hydrolase
MDPVKSGLLAKAPRENARVRVFCFPYAGADTSVFGRWAREAQGDLEICAVELPGRGRRTSDPVPATLDDVVNETASGLAPLLDRPFALFGYSLGALIGFELVRALRKSGLPAPVHLFVAAREAPSTPLTASRPRHDLPQPALLEGLRTFYGRGIDPVILAEPDLMAMFVPRIRADLRLLESYRYRPDAPIDCPITVLVGGNDPSVKVPNLQDWHRETSASCQVRTFPGRLHFFLAEEHAAIKALVEETLR